MIESKDFLTPREIVASLDKYIIGQDDAKRNVAIALRNRWRRMHSGEMRNEIVPNNILMIGSTGVGKTEIARRLAKISGAPFVKVEASKFTEVGYVGRDVESMVRDLVDQSVLMVQQMRKEEVKVKAEEAVEDRILDALIPPPNNYQNRPTAGFARPDEDQMYEKTRERFREKLRNKELEDKKIEINILKSSTPGIGMMGPMGMDEGAMINLQEMLGSMLPKKSKKRKVTVEEARRILVDEEAERLIDMDEVKDSAITKAQDAGVIFIDEIDKIARGNREGAGGDVSREGVQRDLLPIVEGSAVNTKHGVIHTDHILFIAAGAFHVSKPSDLIPELQGRFPVRVELNALTEEDFYHILKDPQNALTKQYEALLMAEGVSLTWHDEALRELARISFEVNSEVENIGARRLYTVLTQLLNEVMFDVPDVIPEGSQVIVTAEMVQEKLQGIVKNKDLSQYIL